MIPTKPQNGDWHAWIKAHYPFDPRWEAHLIGRRESPAPGSEDQLNDLRGIRDRDQAAALAQLWFYVVENAARITKARDADREQEQDKDRRRLIRIAKLALDGKLGDTREDQDNARATAQTYIRQSPEHCSYDDLHDWELMHRYARQVAVGKKPKRPVLAADRRAEEQRRRDLEDMHGSIDAVSATRPRATQAQLGGGW